MGLTFESHQEDGGSVGDLGKERVFERMQRFLALPEAAKVELRLTGPRALPGNGAETHKGGETVFFAGRLRIPKYTKKVSEHFDKVRWWDDLSFWIADDRVFVMVDTVSWWSDRPMRAGEDQWPLTEQQKRNRRTASEKGE
jgi:hypothetical protein